MKYKAGDKVRVRKDIFLGRSYGNWAFIHDMAPLIGKYVTVTKVLEDSYKIEEDTCRITDEMLEDVEEEFKLPEKWCIKSTKENIESLGIYWDDGCRFINMYSRKDMFPYWIGKYWCSYNIASGNLLFSESPGSNHMIDSKPEELLEITFDQFKKYVLKEIESNPVKEEVKVNTLEQSRESLLEEANRRYPVGTKFKSPQNNVTYAVRINHSARISSNKKDILLSVGIGVGEYVYHKGKWAEIVESPKVQQKFTPNDLVICGWYPVDTHDCRYTIGLYPVADESIKNKGESNSSTSESDFPIISTKRIINFSQLT